MARESEASPPPPLPAFVQRVSLYLTARVFAPLQPGILTVITPTMQGATATELTEFARGALVLLHSS